MTLAVGMYCTRVEDRWLKLEGPGGRFVLVTLCPGGPLQAADQ